MVIAEVDSTNTPIAGTEQFYPCDTLLLSCGLIPENELSKNCGITLDPRTNGPVVDEGLETDIDGVFACGNVLHVHDLVDFVSEESARAGESAASFVKRGCTPDDTAAIKVVPKNGVRYTVPAEIHTSDLLGDVHIRFRVTGVFKDCSVVIKAGEEELVRRKSRILVPSEMLDIIIKKDKLEGVNCDITAEIEEV